MKLVLVFVTLALVAVYASADNSKPAENNNNKPTESNQAHQQKPQDPKLPAQLNKANHHNLDKSKQCNSSSEERNAPFFICG